MKKLQFWCVLASFLCALGLSSCSKDEDEPQVVPSIENIKGMWALNTYRIVFGPSENNRPDYEHLRQKRRIVSVGNLPKKGRIIIGMKT